MQSVKCHSLGKFRNEIECCVPLCVLCVCIALIQQLFNLEMTPGIETQILRFCAAILVQFFTVAVAAG